MWERDQARGAGRCAVPGSGALSARDKGLIALGIAVAAGGEGCILDHVRGALGAGAPRDEPLEAVGVAIGISGGPAVTRDGAVVDALAELAERSPGRGARADLCRSSTPWAGGQPAPGAR